MATHASHDVTHSPGLTGLKLEDLQRPEVPDTASALRQLIGAVAAACCGDPGVGAAATTPMLVAHNGTLFDIPLLLAECDRHGVQLPGNWLVLDSVTLAEKLGLKEQGLVENYKLGACGELAEGA